MCERPVCDNNSSVRAAVDSHCSSCDEQTWFDLMMKLPAKLPGRGSAGRGWMHPASPRTAGVAGCQRRALRRRGPASAAPSPDGILNKVVSDHERIRVR